MPRPKPVVELAVKLVQTLRERGTQEPLTLRQLIAHAQAEAAPELTKALTHKTFKAQVVVAAKKNLDAPVALADDLQQLADSALLLEFAVGLLSTAKKPLHPVAKVVAKLDDRLREPFAAAVQRRLDAGTLPPNLATSRIKDVPQLCLRIYLPRLAPEVELAGKLLHTLENQRQTTDYPLPLSQLIQKADPQAPAELVTKALNEKSFKSQVLFALPAHPQTPTALSRDAERLAESPALLELLLTSVCTADNQAAPTSNLAKKAHTKLRKLFAAALDRHIKAATLPPTVGCLCIKTKPHLFLLRDVGAKPLHRFAQTDEARTDESPAIDFAARFDAAFHKLDEQNGSHNFVSLVDLRRDVPVGRSHFDEGLRQLRQTGRYTLSGAEGRHGISAEERDASVNEQGALLLYVSRRKL